MCDDLGAELEPIIVLIRSINVLYFLHIALEQRKANIEADGRGKLCTVHFRQEYSFKKHSCFFITCEIVRKTIQYTEKTNMKHRRK